MARHPIKNLKGDEVGYWDESEFPRIYHTQRSAKDRQIFLHPKYNNAVGLDIRIINKHLIPNQVGVLDFLVVGLEKKSYHAIIRLKDFVEKGKKVNFDKSKKLWWSEQIILSLNDFTRIYEGQQTLKPSDFDNASSK